MEAELKQLGVFYHGAAAFAPLRSAFAASAHVSCREWQSGLIVRIAGGEFAEVVVNLKAGVGVNKCGKSVPILGRKPKTKPAVRWLKFDPCF